ncbi:glycosyltransferase [Methylocystis heyeri]|uniref:Glycosyltransferase n=1 Tax=Methylocystis heyeri TaxID=391905 RepID=A0A6B8KFU1_9HYPH|nr:glycosyltransferase [Methylocystis heyeri]QGM46597.1 glycosyltransferase [Methylocystis heyeri]
MNINIIPASGFAGANAAPHPLFNREWYRRENSDLQESEISFPHYISKGWKEGRAPHPLFSVRFYLAMRPDIRDAGAEPLDHFVRRGWKEGTRPHPLVDIGFYLSQGPSLGGLDPLTHYLTVGWRQGFRLNNLFNADWYLSEHQDVVESGHEPLTHFLIRGEREGRRPTPTHDPHEFREVFEPAFRRYFGLDQIETSAYAAPAPKEEPPSKPAEPGIKPPRLQPIAEAGWNHATLSSVELFKAFRTKSANSPFRDSPPNEIPLLLAKLNAVGRDESLPQEWVSGVVESKASLDLAGMAARLAALGLSPQRAPQNPPAYPVPILNNYNRGRHDATQRFVIDPSLAGIVSGGPKISVLIPVYRPPLAFLERAILSVMGQTYANWELLLVDDCSKDPNLKTLLEYYAGLDKRIKVFFPPQNGGISVATNIAFDNASGEYVALLDHDDMFTRDALECFVELIQKNGDYDLIYSDECKIDAYNIADDLFFKPDWSPFLLLNSMYTGHLSVYRKSTVAAVGKFRSEFDFSQDYDLALRVAERNPKVGHIERILYGWRMISGSAAVGDKPTARNTNIAALQDAAIRRGWGGEAIALPTANRLKRTIDAATGPLVSVIIPSDNVDNIKATVVSLREASSYGKYETIVVTNSGIVGELKAFADEQDVRFSAYDKPYNFSDKCNQGVRDSKGEYVVFFNDDVRVISRDWIECILEFLTLPGVGAVGPKLLYENETIQHAGMVTGVRRLFGTAFHAYPSNTTAYFNLAQCVREVSLICGACLAMPRRLFDEIGGYDPLNAGIAHSDVDLCFRIRAAGYACLYTPHAELTHIGHVSIGAVEKKPKPFKKDKADIYAMRQWGDYCVRDPYFPANMRDLVYIDSQEPFSYQMAKRPRKPEGGKDILLVSHDLSGSGAPRVLFEIAKNLIREGHFVVVASPEDGVYRERLLEIGVDVIIDPLVLPAHDIFVAMAKNFDLVIGNTILTWSLAAALSPFVPVYVFCHETDLVNHFCDNVRGFREGLAAATKVFAAGPRAAASIRRRCDIEPIELECGVEALQVGAGKERGDKKLTIALTGTYEPRKGQDIAVMGFLALPEEYRSNCRLVLAGRTNDEGFRRAIEDIAAEEKSIVFRNELNAEEVADHMAAADIVLVPSRDDAGPLVAMSALSAGKIVVISSTCGVSSYVTDSESGFVLAHNGPRDVAETLQRALDMRDKWPEIGANARKVYDEHFSPARFSERLRQALEL